MNGGQSLFSWLGLVNEEWLWVGLKWGYMVAFGLYVAFAVLVLVQIRQMVAALKSGVDGLFRLVGWVHLGIAVGAFLLALVVL